MLPNPRGTRDGNDIEVGNQPGVLQLRLLEIGRPTCLNGSRGKTWRQLLGPERVPLRRRLEVVHERHERLGCLPRYAIVERGTDTLDSTMPLEANEPCLRTRGDKACL